jgi:hypothetical protein
MRKVLLSLAAVAALSVPTTALAKDKAGRFSGTLKIGPAIEIDDIETQFSLSPEFAIALDRDYNAYLGLAGQFQFGDGWTSIAIPLFFQYDIELPVEGLYLYPKINAGFWYLANPVEEPGFMLEPVFGIKYQAHKNFHVGGEPLGIPMYMGDGFFSAQYHFYVFGGFDI